MEIEFSPSYFVYIITDDQKENFNVNITTNLQNMLAAGRAADTTEGAFHLLYYERYQDKFLAVKRETELAFLSQRKLRKLVVAANPGLECITEPILLS